MQALLVEALRRAVKAQNPKKIEVVPRAVVLTALRTSLQKRTVLEMMNESNTIQTLSSFNFGAQQLFTIRWKGRECWLLPQINDALGYVEGSLIRLISQKWAADIEEGVDYEVLEGEDLANLKKVLPDPGSVSSYARAMTVVFESGVYAICLKSDKPEGTNLRKKLSREILPALRATGKYELPTAKSVPDSEVPQLPPITTEERKQLLYATVDPIQTSMDRFLGSNVQITIDLEWVIRSVSIYLNMMRENERLWSDVDRISGDLRRTNEAMDYIRRAPRWRR